MMGGAVVALTLIGDVRVTWSFSTFTVLIYYAITNLSALYIPAEKRLFTVWVAVAGLVCCASLAFFAEPLYWGVGSAVFSLRGEVKRSRTGAMRR